MILLVFLNFIKMYLQIYLGRKMSQYNGRFFGVRDPFVWAIWRHFIKTGWTQYIWKNP